MFRVLYGNTTPRGYLAMFGDVLGHHDLAMGGRAVGI